MARLLVAEVLLTIAAFAVEDNGISKSGSASRCAAFESCADCIGGGCGWTSWCPYCPGRCLGQGDGAFTCDRPYYNIPGPTCSGGAHPGPDMPSGGYDCNVTSGMCITVPPFVAPSFDSLSACINGCRPGEAKPPLWRCNATTAQCEEVQKLGGGSEGTTKENCEAQCTAHKLCSGGSCADQGVDGPGSATCPSEGCPQPAPGPDCSALSSRGCSECLKEADRCGWCPYWKQCYDIGPHAKVFSCPPGFTTNLSTCPKTDASSSPTYVV
eukprot:TRINITY_DN53679_c0_g1_i1.p1 TRINITY_DN53679_c0_g1~~TRINITY_DN53679_c0_g1_i1.p1  ORF type:complete len:285 (+),score=40.01 TRINITY_DN53679_c0_g1_i1:51-857(+)